MRIDFRKIGIIAIASAAISVAFAGSAFAAFTTIADAEATTVSFTGGVLSIGSSSSPIVYLPATLNVSEGTAPVTFTGLSASGAPTVVAGVDITQALTGGTFSFGTGGSLLKGTFTGAKLTEETDGSGVGLVSFSGVTFTGGSLLPGFAATPAELSTEFNLNTGDFGVTGGTLDSFSGTDGTTASGVSVVPEPASVSTFGIGAGALILLAAIARRRKATSAI